MKQLDDSITENEQRSPLQFPKVFMDKTAKKGEKMTDEELMTFLGTNPQKQERLRLQIEYNKTDNPERKKELLQAINRLDQILKEQKL